MKKLIEHFTDYPMIDTDKHNYTRYRMGRLKHELWLRNRKNKNEIIIDEYEKLNISCDVKNPQIYNNHSAKTTIRETLDEVDTNINLNTVVNNSYNKHGWTAPTTLRELIEETEHAGHLSSVEKIGAYVVQLLNIDLIRTNREDYDPEQITQLLTGIVGSSHLLKPNKEMEAEVTTMGDKILVKDRMWTYQGSKQAPKVEDITLTVERLLDTYNQLDHTTLKQYNSNNTPILGEITTERIEYDNISSDVLDGSIESLDSQLQNHPLALPSFSNM